MKHLSRACFLFALAGVRLAAADPVAWTATGVDGADTIVSGGSQQGAVVALRALKAPLRSEDGKTWIPFNIHGEVPGSLQAAPGDSRIWYATAGDALYRSLDAGATWSLRSRAFAASNRQAGLLYPRVGTNPDLLYAQHVPAAFCGFNECTGTAGTAMISTDGGATWRSANLGGLWLGQAGPHPSPADARVVYALHMEGMSRSDDQGATWTRITPLINESITGYFISGFVTLDRRDPMIVYVRLGASGAPQQRALFATRDGGRTWIQHTLIDGDLVADPLDAGRAWLFGNDGGLLETRDAGGTWSKVEMPYRATVLGRTQGAVVAAAGERVGLRLHGGKLERIDLGDGALPLGSDLWWNPAESGMGLTITQRPNRQAFVVWYAYDATGAPIWRVASGGTWQDRTFTGNLYETRAAPWVGREFDPRTVVVTQVGSVTLVFDDESNALFKYQLNDGGRGEKRITRQLFGPVATPLRNDNYSDLWWNAAESEWGIAINHQYNTVFATWFVYGDDGRAQWLVMPDARMAGAFIAGQFGLVATGDVYMAHGPGAGGPFDPSRVQSSKVGTATLAFKSREEALLDYTVSGTADSKTLTRQPF